MKRKLLQHLVTLISKIFGKWPKQPLTRTILVLRNNNIGDLLTTTPLFKALKDNFPKARIVAGIGLWNVPILKHNPYVDDILILDAPWHNTVSTKRKPNSLLGFIKSIFYILFSRQPSAYNQRIDVGIDVLGSPQGSLLFLKMGIPYRIGVKGYAGGETACQQYLEFDDNIHVSAFALKFAEILGADKLPKARPQLFLKSNEKEKAETLWQECRNRDNKNPVLRVLVGPGGSFREKCWPSKSFSQLIALIEEAIPAAFIAVGTQDDVATSEYVLTPASHKINMADKNSLRDTFALAATADLILCNPSMLMHVAAAFNKPTAVMLGDHFHNKHEHDRLWSYPETGITLGKDKDRDTLYTADEAFEAIQKKGWLG